MNINRNNYEEFFLLYADNELTAAEKSAVDVFVTAHPDLKEELDMLLQSVLPAEDMHFFDKESLYRTTSTDQLVNMTNFESFFVRYSDEELSNDEKAATEQFVYSHPEFQADFELIQQARMTPDQQVVFPDKQLLYRGEKKEEKPVFRIWFSVAAAAIVLLLAGLFWLRTEKPVTEENTGIAGNTTVTPKPATVTGSGKTTQKTSPAPVTNLPEERSTNSKEQPILAQSKKTQQPTSVTPQNLPEHTVQPVEKTLTSEPVNAPVLAANEPKTTPAAVDALNSSNAKPSVQLAANTPKTDPADQIVYVDTDKKPSREDYIYVSGTEENKKTPLRGFFRKAGRVLEQNNPLGAEKKRGGVFTASAEP